MTVYDPFLNFQYDGDGLITCSGLVISLERTLSLQQDLCLSGPTWTMCRVPPWKQLIDPCLFVWHVQIECSPIWIISTESHIKMQYSWGFYSHYSSSSCKFHSWCLSSALSPYGHYPIYLRLFTPSVQPPMPGIEDEHIMTSPSIAIDNGIELENSSYFLLDNINQECIPRQRYGNAKCLHVTQNPELRQVHLWRENNVIFRFV